MTKAELNNDVGGRPTKYSQELADTICERLAIGESLRTVCKPDSMPSVSTIFNWFRSQEGFLEQYEKAKQESADAMAEDILEIADNPQMGEIRTIKPDGSVEVKQDEMLGHRRLQIDTRKFLMAKMKPKRYGDSLDLTTKGEKLPTPILGGLAKDVSTDDSNEETIKA